MPEDPGDHTHMGKGIERVLAENIVKLAAARGRRTQAEIGEAAKIDQRTVGRIMRAENTPGIDKVAAIAKVFGVQPWQLLHPEFDPDAPPEVAGALSMGARLLAKAYDEVPSGPQKHELLAALLGRLQMRDPTPPAPTPGEARPSDEPKLSRGPDRKKRTGKSPARS